VMAMVDLAAHEVADGLGELICLADIARRQQLSLSYLEQLFGKLRRAELVSSARGPGGGYRLARPAAAIAIADVVAAVDEPIRATRCAIGSGGCMLAARPAVVGGAAWASEMGQGDAGQADAGQGATCQGEKCQTHDLWSELGRQITLFLRGVTLADVVRGRVAGRAVDLPADAAPAGAAAG